MVRVYSGATYQPLTSLNGDSAGDRLGTWVRDAGDVNGDGHPDFCAGAPGDDNNGGDSGSLRVYSGLDYSILATLNGDGGGDGLGTSCGGGGDVNGDGFFDVVAGTPGDDNNGGGSGSARVYSLVHQGITHLTPGTPGCAGMQLLNGSTVPKVNTPGFLVFGSRMPPSALNLLLAADAQTLTGSDPLGVGASFYIDFFASTFVLGFDVGSDSKGVGGVNVPIPNDPALAGMVVTFQLASVWGAPCGLGPLNLSTSIAAVATIQP
jgi:hypothetical protein